ncbi:u4/u6 small nuclear ribonucleoprotein prp4 [Anaeramoeba flamelloides]|uniref:U4/u6 small nuclear ribonucleoprotein prp4 n=1 Tax=Anaeramoeba flamelloides TaxID=1746091 RepID=A0AAV7ZI04_9EUKA|nr:u4/u6 small nuclear ribonucleoprotein prp4 [Anaeramoeba flamelloides]
MNNQLIYESRVPIGEENEDLTSSSEEDSEEERHKQELLRKIHLQQKIDRIAIPTADIDVQRELRALGEPICLFGEIPLQRRSRLRQALSKVIDLDETEEQKKQRLELHKQKLRNLREQHLKKIYLIEGPSELRDFRIKIAKFSLQRATKRIKQEKENYRKYLAQIKENEEEKERRYEEEKNKGIKIKIEKDKQKETETKTKMVTETETKTNQLNDGYRKKQITFLQKQISNSINKVNNFELDQSIHGEPRTLSCVSISPDSQGVLIGSWSNNIQLWSTEKWEVLKTYKWHQDFVSDVKFYSHNQNIDFAPLVDLHEKKKKKQKQRQLQSKESQEEDEFSNEEDSESSDIEMKIENNNQTDQENNEQDETLNNLHFASCSMDDTIALWNINKKNPISCLKGHENRVVKVNFHPSGLWLGSCSFDHSWKLWDLNTQQCIYTQYGHRHEIYNLVFHPDGSLTSSAGEDGLVVIWDLRIGRSILQFNGHTQKVTALDFSPNGFHIASGSKDSSIKIWDLRKKNTLYTIPAHSSLVSSLQFEKKNGNYLVSSSFDNTIKIWASHNWSLLSNLKGHSGRITDIDVANNSKFIISTSSDRTFKYWL